jgi:hypothetical protein
MATTRLDRSFPAILRRRPRSPQEQQTAITALFEYADLADEFAQFDNDDSQAGIRLLAKLGASLTRKLIPAFRNPRARDNSTGTLEFYEDLKRAGVVCGLLGPPVSPDQFYAAQFVLAVERLRQQRNCPRSQIFAWLAPKAASPATSLERRAQLPKRYRSLKKSSSLKAAFDGIPKAIRDNPMDYLRPNKLRSPFNFMGEGSGGPGLLGGARQALVASGARPNSQKRTASDEGTLGPLAKAAPIVSKSPRVAKNGVQCLNHRSEQLPVIGRHACGASRRASTFSKYTGFH